MSRGKQNIKLVQNLSKHKEIGCPYDIPSTSQLVSHLELAGGVSINPRSTEEKKMGR